MGVNRESILRLWQYILTILRNQLMVVFSWGFHHPTALPNNKGQRFQVQGFKYQGGVEVIYNERRDLFEVSLSDGTCVEDVYLDNLVAVIDGLVERCDNYEKKIKREYNIA